VAELFFLGAEIVFRVGTRRDFAGNALDDSNPGTLQSFHFIWIIGEQPDGAYAQAFQDFCREREVAVVGFESETFVGFDGVETGILEFIGLELRHQADAAAFLLFVNEDACAFFRNHLKRQFELLPAIAAQGVEDVAGQALGMHPDQRRCRLYVAHDEGNGLFDAIAIGGLAAKTINPELAPAGREIRRSDLLYLRWTHENIIAAGRD